MSITRVAAVVTLTFSLVVILMSLALILNNTSRTDKNDNRTDVPMSVSAESTTSPTSTVAVPQQNTPTPVRFPTTVPSVSKKDNNIIIQSSTYDSPDGTKSLVLKKRIEDGNESFELSVFDKATGSSAEVFSGLKATSQGFLIPYNSWSPDNLYFFLKDVSSGFDSKYLVFNASEKNFADSSEYIDIKKYFDANLSEGYYLEDVTGWAAPYLLIVNTREKNGAEGPSFWFDITSSSFIQLSTKFR